MCVCVREKPGGSSMEQTLVLQQNLQIGRSNEGQIRNLIHRNDHLVVGIVRWRLGKEAGQTKQEWRKSIIRMQGKYSLH
ncbi:hypothetical protein HanPI659440_Chr03g0124191 [Helianthus annuus]|nr:hypothetical protein HanPI659440_Chr03g0124191 [Helianthus annuus]